jgi:hypothetical protein
VLSFLARRHVILWPAGLVLLALAAAIPLGLLYFIAADWAVHRLARRRPQPVK